MDDNIDLEALDAYLSSDDERARVPTIYLGQVGVIGHMEARRPVISPSLA